MFNANYFNRIPFNGVPGVRPLTPAAIIQEKIYIFNANEDLVAVLSQADFLNAKHYEKLNGDNTFTFSYPADMADAAYITEGYLAGFKDLDAAWNVFEIRTVADIHGQNGLERVAFCEHIFYELLTEIVTDKRPSTTALAALTGMVLNTRWSPGIVDSLGTSACVAYYENALSAVQKVANAWAGELQWRIVVTGGVITRYVDLLAARGIDTGKRFDYTKDILEIERKKDATGVYTAMYGRGKGVETESGTAYGRRLTFKDEVWTVAGSDPCDKPADQEYVADTAALTAWGYPDGVGGYRHRYGIYTNEDQTASDTLLQEAWDYLQDNIASSVTYTMKVIALETLTGYSHEAVRLGDTVRVIDRDFTPELVISARIVEIERDLQNPANTTIVLGSFAPMIVDATINTQKRVNEIEKRSYNTNWLDGKISVLQNEIENTAAFIFLTESDGILIMNAATFASATKALKLGGGTFAIANAKSGDAWTWRTFGDGAGFTADEMNAGTLNAGLVSILADSANLTLDGSGLKVYTATITATATPVIHLGQYETGQYGLVVRGGKIYAADIRTGTSANTTYISLNTDGTLTAKVNGYTILESIAAADHGNLYFGKKDSDNWFGRLLYYGDAYPGFAVEGVTTGGVTGPLTLRGDDITAIGNLDVVGDITVSGGGVKHAVENTENYGCIGLAARESPEVRYIDEATGQLISGKCIVEIDPIFMECIEPNTEHSRWHIHLTPYSDVGLYVSEMGANNFVVKELNGGTSSGVEFSWSLSAVRKNMAHIRSLEKFI